MMKKIFFAVILLFSVLLCGCGTAKEDRLEARVFRANGLEITLDTSFAEASVQGYERCYTSKHVDVFVLKESFDLAEGLENMTLSDYAKAMIEGNTLTVAELKKDGSLLFFDYVSALEAGDFHYYSYLYKSEKAFWIVQFAVPEAYREQLQKSLSQWAGSVTFYE